MAWIRWEHICFAYLTDMVATRRKRMDAVGYEVWLRNLAENRGVNGMGFACKILYLLCSERARNELIAMGNNVMT
jgi:hypothetical protein